MKNREDWAVDVLSSPTLLRALLRSYEEYLVQGEDYFKDLNDG